VASRVTARGAVVAATFAVAACGGGSGPPAGGAAPGVMPAVPVEIVTLAREPVEQTSDFVGVLRSRRSATIQPQAEGFITEILVTSGQRVARGTPLFAIDAATQQAAVASLESLRAAREADATYARQQAARADSLLAVGAASAQEVEQAQAQRQAAEAQLRTVEEQIRQQQAELAYYRVVAPTAGVVGDIPVRVGDRVTRATELTRVADNAGLELYVNVPVQDGRRLRTGLDVEILDSAGTVVTRERLNFVSPTVDDQTQTILAKAPITSGQTGLRPDQFVRARLIWSRDPELRVPVISVMRVSGQFFAYVAVPADGGGLVARQQQVDLGPAIGNQYVVRGGLEEGDRLIASGIQKIGDGAPVQPLPPMGAARGGSPGAPGPAGGPAEAPGSGAGR